MGEILPYLRDRSRVTQLNSAPWARYFHTCAGTCANPSYTTVSWQQSGTRVENLNESMSDVVTPDFKTKQAKGEIVNSPLTKVSTTQLRSICSVDYDDRYTISTNCSGIYKNLWRGGTYTGTYVGNAFTDYAPGTGWASTPVIDKQALIDIAVTQMWANADHSKAAALASLGEAKETIQSMASIIGRLIKILIAIKKLDVKYLYKQLSPKELQSRYMEARYALRPLYYDCKQIIDAANHRKLEYDRYTFRGKVSDMAVNEVNTTYNDSFGKLSLVFHVHGKTTVNVDVRSGLLTHVVEPTLSNLWGFDQPFETLWELLPFSFIIDWFFNVGQTIASWTPEAGLTPLASWVVVTETIYKHASVTGIDCTPASGYNYLSNPHATVSNAWKSDLTVTKTRSIDPSRSVLPRFNLNLDTLKLVDLLIIAKQVFS